jgi:hypothetical protein
MARWGANKLKGFRGFRVDKVEEVDSEAEFVPDVEEILSGSSGSESRRTLTDLLMAQKDVDVKLTEIEALAAKSRANVVDELITAVSSVHPN